MFVKELNLKFYERLHLKDKNLKSKEYLEKTIWPNDTLIMHGGGNFGDLYREHNLLRNFLITTLPYNKVLMFPQTINYRNKKLAAADNRVYSNAFDLTMMARSTESYKFALKYFPHVNVLQVPDAAFLLGSLEPAQNPSVDILVLRRTDPERKLNKTHWDLKFDYRIGNHSNITYLVRK